MMGETMVDSLFDAVTLSRLQFAAMAMIHISFTALSVGLSLFIAVMEGLWLKTKDPVYYGHARFWSRILVLLFGMGVVTGLPLEFSFGTNWAPFAAKSAFFGEILGTETLSAFMLEAGFLGIMIFGWSRVPPKLHFFSTCMVVVGMSLSVFWIMVANSWMQTPAGVVLEDGRLIVTSYREAIFNPDMLFGVAHMYVACLETSLLVIGGISAWYVLRGRHAEFFTRSFQAAVIAVVVIAPLQAFIGDEAGRSVARNQPIKLASMEAHWETNAPGQGAPWIIAAWPDQANQRNRWSVEVPHLLSLLLTRSPTGEVKGLKDFPKEEHPPMPITFFSLRIMALAGFAFVGLMLWTLWRWKKGAVTAGRLPSEKGLLFAWMAAGPLAWAAVEGGWVTREVGRQPWLIYGLVRTNESASALPAGSVTASLAGYLVIACLLSAAFVVLAARVLKQGPDVSIMTPPETKTAADR
ncbi:MAG TPA: cytochrome ubiquinol oxidase subunit I [Syntrophales bacterium]|nr:cytochrome ubiquinol oxidase subunit I [Syntrophales bacterium]